MAIVISLGQERHSVVASGIQDGLAACATTSPFLNCLVVVMVVVQLSRWIMPSTVPKVGMSFVDIMKFEMLLGSCLLWHVHM